MDDRWGLGFWLVVVLFVVAAVAWGLVFLILWPVARLAARRRRRLSLRA